MMLVFLANMKIYKKAKSFLTIENTLEFVLKFNN